MADFPVTGASQAFVDALNANFAALAPLDAISSKTANYTIVTADSYKDFDNTGAVGSVTFTLPTPAAGLVFGFAVVAAYNVIVQAPGGSVVYLGTLASSSGGTVSSNSVGSYALVKCRSLTEWLIQSTMGTWTVA